MDDELRFLKRPHRQVPVGRPDLNVRFWVDEGVAAAIQRVLDAGYRTLHSCQWDTLGPKKFRAYINPGYTSEWERIDADFTHADRRYTEAMRSIVNSPLKVIRDRRGMAEMCGLSKGEFRICYDLLWFKPWVTPLELVSVTNPFLAKPKTHSTGRNE